MARVTHCLPNIGPFGCLTFVPSIHRGFFTSILDMASYPSTQALPRLSSRTLLRGLLYFFGSSALSQGPGGGGRGRNSPVQTTTLSVSVRDSGGMLLEAPALGKLRGALENGSRVATTQEASTAVFAGVSEGEYDVEAACVGYQTVVERVSVAAVGSTMQVFVYMPREAEVNSQIPKPQGITMSPKLQ